jgi:hypothetical protein
MPPVTLSRRQVCLAAVVATGLATAISYAHAVAREAPRSSPLTVLSPQAQLPPGVDALRYAGAAHWSAAPGLAEAVDRPGNVALVDATGRHEPLTAAVYLANLPALQRAYRSVLIPIVVWESKRPARVGSWRRLPASRAFLSDTAGKIELTLPPGRYYDIAVGRGGSLVAAGGASDYSAQLYVALGA